MAGSDSVHGSFTVARDYSVPPAELFAAFTDPVRKRRWFAESATHAVEAFESDFRVGGAERLAYRLGPDTLVAGAMLVEDGLYHDIVDGRRIVTSSRTTFEGMPISVALVTIEIAGDAATSRVTCTFQGVFFEGADGPALREQGWRDLLDRLDGALAG